MRKYVLLNISLAIAVTVLLVVILLYVQLTQYDPYSWAFPGNESELSRSLWLKRRSLYERVGLVSFVLAGLLALVKIIGSRHSRQVVK